jgi:hypothetical protein
MFNINQKGNLSTFSNWMYKTAFALFAHALSVTQEPWQFAASAAFAFAGFVSGWFGNRKVRRQRRKARKPSASKTDDDEPDGDSPLRIAFA